tara:strand:+ start:246 stop:365 length:120 start_codon:yes stop_codon:yes gene_type:complete
MATAAIKATKITIGIVIPRMAIVFFLFSSDETELPMFLL